MALTKRASPAQTGLLKKNLSTKLTNKPSKPIRQKKPDFDKLGDRDTAANQIDPFQMEQNSKDSVTKTSTTKEIAIISTQELLTASLAKYVDQYYGFRNKSIENIIHMARVVYNAKEGLSEIEFAEFSKRIACNESTIRKYYQMGKLGDVFLENLGKLPPQWTSIYSLAQLAPATLKQVLIEGKINPSSTGGEIMEIVANYRLVNSSCKRKSVKKFQYVYGGTLGKPIDEVMQRELDALVDEFIATKTGVKTDGSTSSETN